MARVFIGVGHGGNDPGACANGLKESAINLAIALEMKSVLDRHGVTTGISRTSEVNDDLAEEIRECNAFKADYAVDVHTNAGGGIGFEAFHTLKGGKGKELAAKIESEVVKMGKRTRGLKTKANSQGTDYFGFIRSTTCPAIIAECAFIDSTDVQNIDTVAEQKAYGLAYAKGVLAQLGISYKSPSNPTPPSTGGGTSTGIAAGSVVTIKSGAVYGGSAYGKAVPADQLAPKKHTVSKVQVNSGRSEALLKEISSWVPVQHLQLAGLAVGSVVTIKSGAVYGGSAYGKAVPAEQLAPKKHTIAKLQKNSGRDEALLKEISSWVPVQHLN